MSEPTPPEFHEAPIEAVRHGANGTNRASSCFTLRPLSRRAVVRTDRGLPPTFDHSSPRTGGGGGFAPEPTGSNPPEEKFPRLRRE